MKHLTFENWKLQESLDNLIDARSRHPAFHTMALPEVAHTAEERTYQNAQKLIVKTLRLPCSKILVSLDSDDLTVQLFKVMFPQMIEELWAWKPTRRVTSEERVILDDRENGERITALTYSNSAADLHFEFVRWQLDSPTAKFAYYMPGTEVVKAMIESGVILSVLSHPAWKLEIEHLVPKSFLDRNRGGISGATYKV